MNELAIFGEPSGQGWTQIIELTTALVLCSLIGLERELKQAAPACAP
jgi:putative Mg2+ transporter-C (MgtC) family protein